MSATDPTQVHVTVEARFAMIPEALLYDSSICADAVRVYAVLLRHGSDPSNCYPSHRRIANLIGRSPRSIPGWITDLEEGGWLRRIARARADGSPDSNGYEVYAAPRPVPGPLAPQRRDRAGERGPLPAPQRAPSPLPSAPNESQVNESNRNEKTSGGAPGQLALVDVSPPAARREEPLTLVGFDAFWRVYPLKAGKGAARKAWQRAIRRAAAADIIAGAQRYADDPHRKPDFTKYPEGWLNAERWTDEPLPARTAGPGRRSSTAGTMDAARALLASGAHRQATAPALETGA